MTTCWFAGKHLIRVVFGDRWSTRYSSGSDAAKEEIINFALEKLRNSTIIPELHEGVATISKARRNADLAALAVCVLFDFGELYTPQLIQIELVASHMRIVWSMNKRRQYVISGYPSEPTLAIAALHHLHEVDRRKERYCTLSLMRDAVIERHVAKGEKGELVARLILILALYKHSASPPQVSGYLKPVSSISVKDLLSALLPSTSAVDKFWSSSPCCGGSPEATAKTVFGNAKVYFTHFVRYTMTPKAQHLWAAVVRGQAIQCSYPQREVDIIIPVVLDPEAALAEEHMSAILNQVRNRASVAAAPPVAAEIGLFGSELTPYTCISIVFQLSLEKPEGKENKYTLPTPY